MPQTCHQAHSIIFIKFGLNLNRTSQLQWSKWRSYVYSKRPYWYGHQLIQKLGKWMRGKCDYSLPKSPWIYHIEFVIVNNNGIWKFRWNYWDQFPRKRIHFLYVLQTLQFFLSSLFVLPKMDSPNDVPFLKLNPFISLFLFTS